MLEILQIKNGSIEVIDLTNLLKPTNHVKPPPEKKLVTSRRRKRGRANAKPRQPRAKSSAILSYKNGLIIYRGNKVFLLHEKKITLLTHLKDIKSYQVILYQRKKVSYIFSINTLYQYHITNDILTTQEVHYINVNKYEIVDLGNINVMTCQIHTCVCFYGVNKSRTRCFIGHFAPCFTNIEGVINDLKKSLGEEYNEMEKKNIRRVFNK